MKVSSEDQGTGAYRASWIRDAGLALLVAIVFFLLIELGLHLAGAKPDGSLYIDNERRRFQFRPLAAAWQTEEGQVYVKINSQGYRDRERATGRHNGVLRVAVVGDSGVAGTQVLQEETFTQVAERMLAASKIEVLNFGVPNYNLAQQYLTLRDDVLQYRPDVVVEAVSLTNSILNSNRETCVNDSPYPYFIERPGQSVLALYDPVEKPWLDYRDKTMLLELGNRSDFYLYGLKAWRSLSPKAENLITRGKPLPEHFYERSLFPPREEAVAKAWDISEKTLKLMRELCVSRGVQFRIMTMDVAAQAHPDPAMREQERRRISTPDLHYADDRLAKFAGSERIPCLETSRELANYAQSHHVYLHGFFNTPVNYGHLNRAGHRVVGEILARKLGSDGPSNDFRPGIQDVVQD